MIKNLFREFMASNLVTRQFYESARDFYHRARKLMFFLYDAKQTFNDMHWDSNSKRNYWAVSAELLFQYHKLEKGLCMPGVKRFFGYNPAKATIELLNIWRKGGYSTEDPIYKGAIETLVAYRERIKETPPERGSQLIQILDIEISLNPKRSPELQTPVLATTSFNENDIYTIEMLTRARRSVRSFSLIEVEMRKIQRAVAVAQQSPSACNRQPCRVHVYKDRTRINNMLEYQNGNRGFGHTIPLLLVLTADATGFFDASERHEPYIDGGLFAMSLILSLQAQGLSTCCLNWCVEPFEDNVAHERGGISVVERIVMFIAVGYSDDGSLVPRSPRRAIESVMVLH